MPRPRNEENIGLPNRWRFTRGAFYYQVPPGHEKHWSNKKTYRLGETFADALAEFQRVGSRQSVDETIPSHKLRSDIEIAMNAKPLVKEGIYFLLRGNKVVYVGRSENIFARVSDHITGGKMAFDRMHVIEATGYEQERLEQLYIAALTPEYNIYCGGKSPRNSTNSIE